MVKYTKDFASLILVTGPVPVLVPVLNLTRSHSVPLPHPSQASESPLYPWEISHAITLHHSPSQSAPTRLRIRGLGVQVHPGAPHYFIR
jgi:hypothetical protein